MLKAEIKKPIQNKLKTKSSCKKSTVKNIRYVQSKQSTTKNKFIQN